MYVHDDFLLFHHLLGELHNEDYVQLFQTASRVKQEYLGQQKQAISNTGYTVKIGEDLSEMVRFGLKFFK